MNINKLTFNLVTEKMMEEGYQEIERSIIPKILRSEVLPIVAAVF